MSDYARRDHHIQQPRDVTQVGEALKVFILTATSQTGDIKTFILVGLDSRYKMLLDSFNKTGGFDTMAQLIAFVDLLRLNGFVEIQGIEHTRYLLTWG